MKSSNLALRVPEFEPLPVPEAPRPPAAQAEPAPPEQTRSRPRFECRTIEIRDQGFGVFRVR